MMKIFLIFIILPPILGGEIYCQSAPDSGIQSILSKNGYERLFPHHHLVYSYENFIAATKEFPQFAHEGTFQTRKKELVAFFASVAHETSSGWEGAQDGAYVWGLFYTEEQGCKDGHCNQYNTSGTSSYQPVPGKSYYGRGPIQLTYAYNYGMAGADLSLPLLEEPELIATDGVIAFKTALWFWMREQKPKPSCHNVICGNWQPSDEDRRQNRRPGFGMIINIINGGVECNSSDPEMVRKRKERIGFYKYFSVMLDSPVGDNLDCDGMGIY
jgi:basic endochitinase B